MSGIFDETVSENFDQQEVPTLIDRILGIDTDEAILKSQFIAYNVGYEHWKMDSDQLYDSRHSFIL